MSTTMQHMSPRALVHHSPFIPTNAAAIDVPQASSPVTLLENKKARHRLRVEHERKARRWLPLLTVPSLLGIILFSLFVGHPVYHTVKSSSARSRQTHVWESKGGIDRPADLASCRALASHTSLYIPCYNNSSRNDTTATSNKPARKTLYVQPYGGLGSRLRGLASGLTLARDIGVDVVIVWQREEFGYAGAWHELFQEPDIPLGCFPGESMYSEYAQCEVHYVNSAEQWADVQDKWEARINPETRETEQILCIKSVMYLTPNQKGISWFYPLLKPAPHLLAKANQFLDEYKSNNSPWVGVHIRRTDLKLKCNTENCQDGLTVQDVLPLSKYTAVLKSILNVTTSTGTALPRFYLATDDLEAETVLKQDLDELLSVLNHHHSSTNITQQQLPLIVSYTKSVRDQSKDWLEMRSSVSGIEEAVIDLYLLSRGRMVVGTVGSTFSMAARWMTGGAFYSTVGAEYENAL